VLIVTQTYIQNRWGQCRRSWDAAAFPRKKNRQKWLDLGKFVWIWAKLRQHLGAKFGQTFLDLGKFD